MDMKLCVNDWVDLFAELAIAGPHVFWMGSLDYKEHFFHSQGFSTLYAADDQLLYHHREAFDDLVISDTRDQLIQTWASRHESEKKGVAFYKVKNPEGNGRYIRDYFTTLYNERGEPLAAAGLAMEMTDQMSLQQQHLNQAYRKLLQEKLKLIASTNGNPFAIQEPELSKREQQCIYHLLQSKTAKQTAEIMHISRRTVEKHLENIKSKFNCSQKMELLNLLMERNYKSKLQLE